MQRNAQARPEDQGKLRALSGRRGPRGAAVVIQAVLTLGLLLPWAARPVWGESFNISDGDVPGLITAILTSNGNMEDDIINLASAGTYTLHDANDPTDGGNGLPVVVADSGHSLAVNGNGSTVERSSAGGTPDFRILQVGSGAIVAIDRLTLRNGRLTGSSRSGGGIRSQGTLILTRCTVSGNSVATTLSAAGGGIDSQGTLTLSGSTVSGNLATTSEDQFASSSGGGIYSGTGPLTLINSTVSGNISQSADDAYGGGVTLVANGGHALLLDVTLAGNGTLGAHTSVGSNLRNNGGTTLLRLKNSIVASPMAGFLQTSCSGSITDLGGNLDDGSSCGVSTANGSKDPNTPAGLDPSGLHPNGGPTLTIALVSGSAAIDMADPNTCADPNTVNNLDQRGFARPRDGDGSGSAACDIGAFEALEPSSTLLVSSMNPSELGMPVPFSASVTVPPGSGTPTGSVTFFVDNVSQGSFSLNVLGQAAFTASGLPVGLHDVLAVYVGDLAHLGSTSNTVAQVVNLPPTATPTATSTATPTVTSTITRTATATGTPIATAQTDQASAAGLAALALALGTLGAAAMLLRRPAARSRWPRRLRVP